jgi:hypothetical protein
MNKTLSLLAALSCGAALTAQSPLNVFPVAPVGYYGWNTPPPITSVMVNMTVTSQVTLQAISTLLSTPVGVAGRSPPTGRSPHRAASRARARPARSRR